MHVWIADTPSNRAAAEGLWAVDRSYDLEGGVTTFRIDHEGSPEQWCADILPVVIEHHGEYAHDPPVSVLEVRGSTLTAALQAGFEKFGFVEFVAVPGGFRARSR